MGDGRREWNGLKLENLVQGYNKMLRRMFWFQGK
jgi:hypothetical protein